MMPDELIFGATDTQYVPTDPADVGRYVYCRVRGDNAYGFSTANSNVIGPIVAATASAPAMTNLYLWLRADAGVFQSTGLTTPATATNDPVAGWQDQGPSGTRHFTQATSARAPTLQLGGAFPVLRFDHTADTLNGQHLDGPDMSALTGGEIFIVLKALADPSGGTAGGSLWNFGSSLDSLYPYSSGDIYETWGWGSRAGPIDPGVQLDVFRVYNVVSDATGFQMILDGTSIHTDSAFVEFATATRIGRSFSPGAGNTFDGDIAEVVMYSARCSAPDKAQTKAYLTAKYSTA